MIIDASELPFSQKYVSDIYNCILFGWEKEDHSPINPSEADAIAKVYLNQQIVGVQVSLATLLYGLGLYPFDLDSLIFARNL